MTGGELLLKCLREQGVRALFGMPGTQNLAVYDAFHRAGEGISHVLIRDEQAATLMACGYARASGALGVALTVPGPGATNASTGIGDAFTDCQPVLLITGGFEGSIAARDRSKLFHGLDQASFFRPIVRYYGCPQSAAQIPRTLQAAVTAMYSGRPGPAVLEIPPDVAAEQVADETHIPERFVPRFDRQPDAKSVDLAASFIRQSQRPVIIAGGDVIASDATAALDRFSRQFNMPVILTRLGKCALSTDHPLNVGNCRHKPARAALESADALIAVGVRFTQIDTSNWKMKLPQRLIQIDRDAREIGREVPATAGLLADLAPSLDQLAAELGDWKPTGWTPIAVASRADRPPVPVLSDIRHVLDPSGILVCDITSLSYRAFEDYPVFGPRDLLYSCHYVTMGFGLPAALGAKVGCPDRPVVALCGDGGVLMSISELATAAQYNIPVVIVVVADGALLAIKASQIKHYGARLIDTELPIPDFVKIAESFGVSGHRVASLDQFRATLANSLASGRPALIEVPMADRQADIIEQIPWLSGE